VDKSLVSGDDGTEGRGGDLEGPASDKGEILVEATGGKEIGGADITDDSLLAGMLDAGPGVTCPNSNPGRTVDATGGNRYNLHQLILPDASVPELPSVAPVLALRALSITSRLSSSRAGTGSPMEVEAVRDGSGVGSKGIAEDVISMSKQHEAENEHEPFTSSELELFDTSCNDGIPSSVEPSCSVTSSTNPSGLKD